MDDLAQMLGCYCVSDLHFRTLTPEEAREVWARYQTAPETECREAADYLLGVRLDWPDSPSALAAVIGRLSAQPRRK